MHHSFTYAPFIDIRTIHSALSTGFMERLAFIHVYAPFIDIRTIH